MPSVRVVCLIALLSSAPSLAAQQRVVVQGPDTPPPKRIVMPHVVEAPLVESRIAGAPLPVLEVTVNGKGPFRFGIETGAGFIGISPGFASKAGLVRSGGDDDFPEYTVDSINIGGASFKELRVAAGPKGATGVDGILGLPFFRDVLLTIDYANQRTRLERDTLPAANGKDILPLTHEGPFWAMPISIAGQQFSAVLDTRSTVALSMSPEVAGRLPFDGELTVIGRSGGAGIPLTELKAGRLAGDVMLGRYRFPLPELMVRALPPGFPSGPLVGVGVLQNFVLTLDQSTARLRLAREGDPVIQLPTRRP